MNLLEILAPRDVKLGVFLLKHTKLRQHRLCIAAFRQNDAVIHNRLEDRFFGICLVTESHSVICIYGSRNGADASRLRFVDGYIFLARIDPYLVDLLGRSADRHRILHVKHAARDLKMGQAVVFVTADLKNLCSESVGIILRHAKALQTRKKLLDPRQP